MPDPTPPDAMKTRIIVCGLGRAGYQVFRLLKQQGAIVVGVNQHPLPENDLGMTDEIIVGELSAASTLRLGFAKPIRW